MAIKRYSDASSEEELSGSTSIPDERLPQGNGRRLAETKDISGIDRQYQNDAESNTGEKVTTGTMLPKDLTVKLIRADTSNWETFLSCLYSIFLTLFGLFLGSWLSSGENLNSTFSSLEITATIAFGVLSLLLIGIWIYIKVCLQRSGVRVAHDVFETIKEESVE